MRGLTLILASAEPARFRTALTLAAAQAALGGRVRLFVDAGAVPLLRLPVAPADQLETALALGVELQACQTGLADAALTPADCHPATRFSGVVSLLQTLGEDRLVGI